MFLYHLVSEFYRRFTFKKIYSDSLGKMNFKILEFAVRFYTCQFLTTSPSETGVWGSPLCVQWFLSLSLDISVHKDKKCEQHLASVLAFVACYEYRVSRQKESAPSPFAKMCQSSVSQNDFSLS